MQILIGLFNTSNVMTLTCIGELTDGSNVNSVFRLIPLTRYVGDGIGGAIGGAAMGTGLLPPNVTSSLWFKNATTSEEYPYFRQ